MADIGNIKFVGIQNSTEHDVNLVVTQNERVHANYRVSTTQISPGKSIAFNMAYLQSIEIIS